MKSEAENWQILTFGPLCISGAKYVTTYRTNVWLQVTEDVWPVFLSTVVTDEQATMADDVSASDLHVSLRSLLREVRSTLGSAGWTKALLEMGAQPATLLRRRYKLF